MTKAQLNDFAFFRVEMDMRAAEYLSLTPVEKDALREAWANRRAFEMNLHGGKADGGRFTAEDFLPKPEIDTTTPEHANEVMDGMRRAFPDG